MRKLGLVLSLVICLGVGAVHANTIAGDSVVITDNATHKTFNGQHLRVVVSASNCDITLTGHVDALSISGGKNKITVNAKADAIALMGTGNTLTWSKKANPTAPALSDNGTGNTVKGI